MDEPQLRTLVREALGALAPEVPLDTIGDDEDLREALDLDSMDFLNFTIALSRSTGRAIPEADLPRLRTLRGVLAYLG